MIEKTITLDEIDPVDIYGVNNKLIDLLSGFFPNMKVVARGSEILLRGSISDVRKFEEKINILVEKRFTKSRLNEDDINSLFDGSPKGDGAEDSEQDIIVYGNEGRIIRARTKNQRKLVESYYKNDLIFAIGPAGTGKTYTAIALAVRALKNKEVKKLILTRPAVEAGERLGFLPGDLREKLDPYLQPLYDALRDMIPAKKLEFLIEDGTIQIAPLAYMRGRTLESAFVILDEAQNTTYGQLKMFLTRMGGNSKFVVTGDATQIDLPHKSDSGLIKGVELLGKIKGVCRIDFGKEDIVRHKLVSKIVQAFDKHEAEQ
ncbi:MAG TPA: PhoH family protein [Bacteroidales bacterium]|nr:PhoH family protein [Bacteroidales bacterium]HNW48355.1 PhoH family protein [Bacteroidales bacterium]HPS95090.1 PhoH family protein [Bacteroidales bacterium]